MPIIEVDHLSKEYQLGQLASLKDSAVNLGRRLIGQKPQPRQKFKALDDVSFSIEQGEVVGIIGHNGAGKSTLLKHLAQITRPTRGTVTVRGSVAPLIEVGAGFNPELTGRENIFLNASILGIPKRVIKQKLDEIVSFAELEQFIDTPVKRYSSGMAVRLGFSVATSMEADILIVDEVLAVGDIAFQRKCIERMEDLIKNQGKTVLIVGHNIRQLERMCSRMMLLRHGRLELDGNPGDVSKLFFDESTSRSEAQLRQRAQHGSGVNTDEVEIRKIELLSCHRHDGQQKVALFSDLNFRITLYCSHDVKNVEINIGMHNAEMIFVTKASTLMLPDPVDLAAGENVIDVSVPKVSLSPGPYGLGLGIYDWTRRPLGGGTNLLTLHVDVTPEELPKLPVGTLTYFPAVWKFSSPGLEY
ncbi:ABC-type polysaccharide/polyol phosphate transport system, ATPase component [Methylocaldum marinum]|uniref:ABC-type polysaccharide/polyol phosphate transport system, ATPase component n=1 Tax=Methylocaldum marinum TaxID=1432792 RepID=A0A286P451_9GAMM|nr:ABC transporter ATP-binding protein [Methylocaldum marinum]BBA32423.1 ABC-type polysaccharide/polyol phosphate transport system, ATPase component [Methylocaldum marinum]